MAEAEIKQPVIKWNSYKTCSETTKLQTEQSNHGYVTQSTATLELD